MTSFAQVIAHDSAKSLPKRPLSSIEKVIVPTPIDQVSVVPATAVCVLPGVNCTA
jgi:hypothetical protein